MPKPQQYRAGSLIYFNGDPANQVFILQKGKVNLNYQDIETNEDQHDMVQPGEFFGVKSALGRYPREENAMAIQDATIMAFTVPEFEALAAANTRIIMKMLKVFSNQLRRIHKQVSSLMAKEEQNPEAGLFSLGQYYVKNKRFREAQYVLSRYLTYYPAGKNAAQVAKDLEMVENYMPKSAAGSASPMPSMAAAAPVSSGSQSEAAKAYEDALNLVNQQKYQQAYLSLKRLADSKEELEYSSRSFFEIGRCIFYLGKYEECIKHCTMAITKYPKHPDLYHALFFIGQSYEKMNQMDQAMAFYKKVLSMAGDAENEFSTKARKSLRAYGVAGV